MTTKAIPLGTLIDQLQKARVEKQRVAKLEEAAAAEYKRIEALIFESLAGQGLEGGKGKLATASISAVTVANVEDWDKFHAFVKKTGYFHLLQRRVSDPAFRELLEQKGAATMAKAGVVPFVKHNLSLTTLK